MSVVVAERLSTGNRHGWVAGRVVPGFGPTGADLLVLAARLLPEVAGGYPLSASLMHEALQEAVRRWGAGVDRLDRLRLADEACDLLAEYLVVAGMALPERSSGRTVAGWMAVGAGYDVPMAQRVVAAAGAYWRGVLDAALAVPTAVRRLVVLR